MSARHAALLGALAALWGSAYLLIKYALRGFSPGEIVFCRAAVSAALLWPLCWAQGGATRTALGDPRRRPLVALALGCWPSRRRSRSSPSASARSPRG